MSPFFRRRIEATIEHMIAILDELDGDADLEHEPAEEQHDREDDRATAPVSFVVAEARRRFRNTRH
jgi:hypothetical protein